MRSRNLTDEELQKILHNLPRMYEILCLTMFFLGVRVSEALTLTRGAVKKANGEIRDTFSFVILKKRKKMNRVRKVPQELRLAIKDWTLEQYERTGFWQDDTPLFTQSTRKAAVTRWSVWNEIKKACERSGIDPHGISCHSLRKCFCQRLLKVFNTRPECKRDPLYAVRCLQSILGHTSLETTLHYTEAVQYDVSDCFGELARSVKSNNIR